MSELPDLPLKDRLALDRTLLANDRTWLATARTAIGIFVTGASFLRFFDVLWLDVVGVVALVASVPVAVVGWTRYRRQHRRILDVAHAAAKQLADPQPTGQQPAGQQPADPPVPSQGGPPSA